MEAYQSMDDQFLSKVHSTIEQNIDNENYSVEKLAKDVGLSRSMLHRKLIKLSGKNASETITHIRLTKARELLENNTATVSETAYKVGYKTPSYFNKVFKQHYHFSPGDIKKKSNNLLASNTQNEHITLTKTTGLTSNRKKILFLSTLIFACLCVSSLIIFNPFSGQGSIAVLPLENLTGNPDNNYIIDGIHDALIGELGRISSLRVISRKSTLRYKESNMLMKDIATELNVENIIEGSVISAGDSIHLIIQVIKVFPKEQHLMANDYHDKLSNVLQIQNSIAKEVAHKVKARISKKEIQQMTHKRTVNPEVYKSYLRGMYALHQGSKEWFEEGIDYMNKAIQTDPGDPFAYAGLALGYATMGHGQLDSENSFKNATNAANKAIKLDPTIDESYTALSLLHLYNDWNWSLAKASFENALSVNPNNAEAHAHFAWYHYLFHDIEQSIYHAYQATLIEPLSPVFHAWLGLLYCHNKQFDKAEKAARKALDLNSKAAYGHLVLGWCFLNQKQYHQAITMHERLPESLKWDSFKASCYNESGQNQKAMEIWKKYKEKAKTQQLNPCYMGLIASCVGLKDEAFKYLNEAVDKKIYPITYLYFNPCCKNIKDDIRFSHLLQRMKIPHRNT